MMLTALQSNPSSFVFSHIHNSDSSPPSMETNCSQTTTLRHSSTVALGKPSTAASPNTSQEGGAPQMIPIAMVPPPHIVIGPGGNYTIIPSISSANERPLGNLTVVGQSLGQFTGAGPMKPYIIPAAYYGHPESQGSTSSELSTGHLSRGAQQQAHDGLVTHFTSANSVPHQAIPAQATPLKHPQPHPTSLQQDDRMSVILQAGTRSPADPKPSRKMSSASNVPPFSESVLGHEAVATDTVLSKRHYNFELDDESAGCGQVQKKRRLSDSHDQEASSCVDESESADELRERPAVLIKEETEVSPSCHRGNSNPTSGSDDNSTSRLSSYPVNALVDVPMNAPLTRSSRTSSLSSSLSSFRFGGSLSQLWASQMSLSGKLPNMKSTGNINAETASMPSLGNQYFAFGGSLPELSLTSLTRLLPSSGASDPNISSCPGLFTLLHPPLYVYPSQQHLATPFINANGSISFGSFLSGGSSLCNAQKSSSSREAAGSSSSSDGQESKTTDKSPSTDLCSSSSVVTSEVVSEVENRGSTSSLSSHDGIKFPVYSHVSPLISYPHIITALPSLAVPHSSSHSTSSLVHSTASQIRYSVSSPANAAAANLSTLPCMASTSHQSLTSPASTHRHHILHTSATGDNPHIHLRHPHHNHLQLDSKDGILGVSPGTAPYLAVNRPGVIQPAAAPGSACMDLNCVKVEGDHCLTQSPVKLTPVVSMPMSDCLGGTGNGALHSSVDMQAHLQHSSHTHSLEHSPKRDKPYKCDHPGCGRSFSFPAHLRSHVQQIHISYRPCKCDFPSCGKRFYTPQHLNVHRRVHTGERPFVCPYTECSKAFTTAGNLKNHIRIHTGERPYSCKFEGCSKCFAEMSSLKKHELTHTGEKPYKCRVCGKAFSQAGSRNTHERKHSRLDEPDDLEEGGSSRGSRRFRIKRISSSSSSLNDKPMVKSEPL